MPKAVPITSIEGQSMNIPTVAGTGGAPAHDLSIYSMFVNADIIVQLVIVLLLCASFWCWAIFFDKFNTLRILQKRMKKFEKNIWACQSLEHYYETIKATADNPIARVFIAGMHEWMRLKGENAAESGKQKSLDLLPSLPKEGDYARRGEIKDRVWHAMDSVRNREIAALEKGLSFLATVGSSAPFIGLFGTVWGIMNSFQAIAHSQNSTLAVVAPGIAEALFATAIGLFAAIPAVIFYNKFSTQCGGISDRIDEFSDEFASVIARELDKY